MIRARLEKDLDTTGGRVRLALDLRLEAGEPVALYGPSGAGKTTVLRMLAGLTRPDAGSIEIDGRLCFDGAGGLDVPPQGRGIGLVFQDCALFPHMTVEENLRFALRRGQEPAMVEELLEATGMSALRDRRPARLSGGQRQRTALARALVPRPRWLLLDEPLSALDRAARAALQDLLRELQGRYGVTPVLVSHDASEVARVARRVVRLESGRVAGDGAPEEVLAA
ncbi:MAG: ATP-binding cassette domain-containing protein [Elusimicrobia bacterium]|nr:ATP-binding cassette domain-containing protein [Elusimicrobiota bacterium]